MILNYLHQDDGPLPGKNTPIDDDAATGWWAGVRQCAASVALATVVTTTALSSALALNIQVKGGDCSDIPAGSLKKFTAPDEDFWDNPATPPPLLVLTTVEAWPQPFEWDDGDKPFAAFAPDEDYWDNPATPANNPPPFNWFPQYSLDTEVQPQISFGLNEDGWDNPATPITLAAYAWPQPFAWDEGTDATVLLDEDGWDNPATPLPLIAFSYGVQLPLGDAEELPATTLSGQPDEDFWDNPVAPVVATLYQPLPLGDADELAAGALRGTAEEDYWDNPSSPNWGAAVAWPQPFTFDDGLDATIALDEDYWFSADAPAPFSFAGLAQFNFDADSVTPVATFGLDEDYWQHQVRISGPFGYGVLSGGPGALTAISTDEDHWQNPVAPASLLFAPLYQFKFDSAELVPFVAAVTEEEYYTAPLLPNYFNSQNVPSPWTFGNAEDSPGGVAGQPDEDYWQNYAAPDSLVLTWPQPFSFEQNEVTPSALTPEEDYWLNYNAPDALALVWPQPFSFEQDSVRSTFIPDEDYWQNAVAPVNTVYNLQLPIEDAEELSAGALKGQPDEDFWQNTVTPLPLTFGWPQQAAFEQNDLVPHTAAPPDEDFWDNAVAPVPAAFAWTQPFTWDIQEPGSLVNAKPDEDYWLQLVAPKQLALSWPQPFAFDVQEAVTPTFTPDEDNWQAAPPLSTTALQVPAPWIFGYEDAPGGTVIQIDDTDYRYNPLSLILNPVAWPQPFTFEQNETVPFVPPPPIIEEEYWQNAVAPVSATYAWPQPWIFETQDLQLTAFNLPTGITGVGTVFTYSGTGAVLNLTGSGTVLPYAGKGKLQ